MRLHIKENGGLAKSGAGGLGIRLLGRLMGGFRRDPSPGPRLALLERIALAPRQSLALVQAEGRLLLVATSAEGAPAFYALDERARPGSQPRSAARVSW